MFKLGESSTLALVAIVSIVAFVIVVLAFFFTAAPTRGLPLMIGQPHEAQQATRETFISRTESTDRLNRATQETPREPDGVRANGLP